LGTHAVPLFCAAAAMEKAAPGMDAACSSSW
jgi:hypothetical protein